MITKASKARNSRVVLGNSKAPLRTVRTSRHLMYSMTAKNRHLGVHGPTAGRRLTDNKKRKRRRKERRSCSNTFNDKQQWASSSPQQRKRQYKYCKQILNERRGWYVYFSGIAVKWHTGVTDKVRNKYIWLMDTIGKIWAKWQTFKANCRIETDNSEKC